MYFILAGQATLLIEGRTDIPKNFARAFSLACLGVRRGCIHCLGVLARCYYGGFGCHVDELLAEFLAKKSASAGSRYGYFVLGNLAYKNNHLYLAKMYWQNAANLGLAVAQVNLAKLYLNEAEAIKCERIRGNVSERASLDILFLEEDAIELLFTASTSGHPIAWQELGLMYMHGTYVPLNMLIASTCFMRSRRAGNEELLIT